MKSLELIAEALLEYETIDGVHVNEILNEGKIVSPVIGYQAKPTEKLSSKKKNRSAVGCFKEYCTSRHFKKDDSSN